MLRMTTVLLVAMAMFVFAGCESDDGGLGGGGGSSSSSDTTTGDTAKETGFGTLDGSTTDQVANSDATATDTIAGDTTTDTTVDTTPDTYPDTTPDTMPDTTPDTTPDTGSDTTIDVPDSTPQGLSCKEFYMDCLPACPAGAGGQPDQACVTQCQNNLSTSGQQELGNFQGCMQQNGCFNAASEDAMMACLEDNCLDTYLGCFHGELSCSAMLECMNSCAPTNQECLGNCMAEGTANAQMTYQAIGDCIVGACCGGEQAACANNPDYETCAQGSYQPGGVCEAAVMGCVNDLGFINGDRLPITLPAWIFTVHAQF